MLGCGKLYYCDGFTLSATVTNGLTVFAPRGVEAAEHITVTSRILKFTACKRFIPLTRRNSLCHTTCVKYNSYTHKFFGV